jgi:hypothetical protein
VLAFFLVFLLIIRVIDAWISLLIASSFLAKLFLMSPPFLLPRRSLPLLFLTSFSTMLLLSSSLWLYRAPL